MNGGAQESVMSSALPLDVFAQGPSASSRSESRALGLARSTSCACDFSSLVASLSCSGTATPFTLAGKRRGALLDRLLDASLGESGWTQTLKRAARTLHLSERRARKRDERARRRSTRSRRPAR